MNCVTSLISACLVPAASFAGIGIEPHAPEPPLEILTIIFASAVASPLYLSATACQDGPTTFLSIAWQAVQFSFFAIAGISVAIAEPATNKPAAAIMLTKIDFIVSPCKLNTVNIWDLFPRTHSKQLRRLCKPALRRLSTNGYPGRKVDSYTSSSHLTRSVHCSKSCSARCGGTSKMLLPSNAAFTYTCASRK